MKSKRILPTTDEVKKAVFEYKGLENKTVLRWPIPLNAKENLAFHDGIMWFVSKIEENLKS